MSDNTFILIKKLKKQYEVTLCDAETSVASGKTYKVRSALKALRKAREIVDEEDSVEYGITYVE